MVGKLGKVICCMFLCAILGVDPTLNLANSKGGYVCSYNLPIQCYSNIVNEQKTKNVRVQGPSNINLSLFVYFFDVDLPS